MDPSTNSEDNSEDTAEKGKDTFSSEFNKRKEKVLKWIKIPHNFGLTIVLLFAFIIRLYYFILTRTQAVWWDEGEYASGAIGFATNMPADMDASREIIIPYIWSLLYRIYPGEILWRFGQFAMSVAFVIIIYLCAKAIFNKKTGLITGAFASFCMLLLFYTGRLVIYMWGGMLFTLGIYLFYEGYINKKGIKWIYASAIVISFGTVVYYSVALAGILIALFLILTVKLKDLIADKNLIKPLLAGIAILGSYMTFSYIKYGFLHPRLYQAVQLAKRPNSWGNLFGHFKSYPHLFGMWWILLLILGIIISLKIFLMLDIIILKKQSSKKEKSLFFLAMWFWFIMAFYTFMAVTSTAPYEGFLIPVFPAVGMLGAIGLIGIQNILKKYFSKAIAISAIILIILMIGIIQVKYSHKVIISKQYSFVELKYAGEWIRENSNLGDRLFSQSHPPVSYYSQRLARPEGIWNEENFRDVLVRSNTRYVVISPYDSPPPWLFSYPEKYPGFLNPVYSVPYHFDTSQTMVIVYEVDYDKDPNKNLSNPIEELNTFTDSQKTIESFI